MPHGATVLLCFLVMVSLAGRDQGTHIPGNIDGSGDIWSAPQVIPVASTNTPLYY
ncbi:uncharacterized protein METZ01_LOCUS429685 [marine metagenome]|uniref:Uncharacterized protein n=1 Tax=marine metagenome TaxID=408172 RepID=A0A382Y238_9ZZZZ